MDAERLVEGRCVDLPERKRGGSGSRLALASSLAGTTAIAALPAQPSVLPGEMIAGRMAHGQAAKQQ
jgi:hypothetical protein